MFAAKNGVNFYSYRFSTMISGSRLNPLNFTKEQLRKNMISFWKETRTKKYDFLDYPLQNSGKDAEKLFYKQHLSRLVV